VLAWAQLIFVKIRTIRAHLFFENAGFFFFFFFFCFFFFTDWGAIDSWHAADKGHPQFELQICFKKVPIMF